MTTNSSETTIATAVVVLLTVPEFASAPFGATLAVVVVPAALDVIPVVPADTALPDEVAEALEGIVAVPSCRLHSSSTYLHQLYQ